MQAKVIRVESTDEGTLGVLTMDGEYKAMTLEPEDRQNQQNVSCIPAGRYVCQRVASPRFGDTFEVLDVPGRSHILFHAGNTEDDTRGCFLLGATAGRLRGDRAVLNSGKTFRDFIEQARAVERFDLLIVDETGGYE